MIQKKVARTRILPTPASNEIKNSPLARNFKPLGPNDPIPAIIAAFGVALGGQLLTNMIESLAEGATRPATSGIDYGSRLLTYTTYRGMTLDAIMAALKASVYTPEAGDGSFVNFKDDDVRDTLDKIIVGTILATTMVSEDAGEIVMESFQEAFSNATYYGIGGMFASTTAYRAGFMPPNNFFMDPGFDLLDAHTKANLDAMVGQNAYTTTAQHVMRIANRIVESYSRADKLDSLLRLLSAYGDRELHMLANADRLYDTVIDYVVEQTRTALTVLLRRTIDIRDTIRAAYADYKVQPPLIDETMFRIILYDAQLELQEIRNLKDEILNDLEWLIDNMPTPDTATLGYISDVIDRLEKALDSHWSDEFSEMKNYISTMKLARRLTKSTGMTWSYLSRKTGQQTNYTW